MNRVLFFRIATALSLLGFAVSTHGQTPNVSTQPQTTTTTDEVVYTGRLLGYFRVPSLQKFDAQAGCPQLSLKDSQPAIDFLNRRNSDHPNAILVGTGDNFSPELEARVFEKPPSPPGGGYAVGNKELYFSDNTNNTWVYYRNVPAPLDTRIKNGLGTIHTDNVGCFLRAAAYAGIVPGKHDFYFGAERVRQLARFLADTQKYDFKPVQMLGANLVLKTSPITDRPIPLRLKENPRLFKAEWSEDYPVQNLSDGGSVYPWFSYVKIQIGKLPANEKARETLVAEFEKYNKARIQLPNLPTMIANAKTALPPVSKDYSQKQKTADENQLNKLITTVQGFPTAPIYICASDGNPNEIPRDIPSQCNQRTLANGEVRLVGEVIVYSYELSKLGTGSHPHPNVTLPQPIGAGKPFANGTKQHFSTLLAGRNYGLCTIITTPATPTTTSTTTTNCLRFSVHTPFFYFPHYVPMETADYTDPDPYVVIDDRAAVFGVVDPDLGSQVGILNFGWQNDGAGLTSKTSVEDPIDAVQQQLDYFERQHGRDFKGLKILLAQTSPQRAKALAARFPEFQMVVSAADLDQTTSGVDMDITWKPGGKLAVFVGVPTPYFDWKTRKGAVRFGTVNAEKKVNDNEVVSWKLTSIPTEPTPIAEEEDEATEFWKKVTEASNCLRPNPQNLQPSSNPEALKLLVLCTMRERLSADVALIQSRDLFEKIPLMVNYTTQRNLSRAAGLSATNPGAQEMLDRLIWKGDLLTLLYVPGSAIKSALAQSEKFEGEEQSALSFVMDRGRKLETLGISQDAVTKEYLINEVPIDDKKIYAVATTDFLSSGDTGYPDLVDTALNPRRHPAAFTEDLESISSLVCRKLYPATADTDCLGPIKSKEYLDKTVAAQIEPHKQPSAFKRFKEALPFKPPAANSPPSSYSAAVEQRVQRRSIWTLSLKDFSFGFNSLDNNFSDSEIEVKFGGNPTSSVQATQSRTWHFGADIKFLHSAHSRDFYIEPGADYKRQTTGDTPNKLTISQMSNRFFVDSGMVLWRRPGRPLPNVGLNLSLHTETQLQQPFSTFTLSNAEQDVFKIYQERSWLALPRLGLRWQNRDNYAEFGVQAGREFNALLGYRFDTIGGEVNCLANSTETFGKCISDNSGTADGITKDTPVTALSQDRPRAGVYWKTNFAIPFGPRVKYVLDEEADFLFVNFRQDTSIDTRFRDISKHTLSFSIWPSISIGPTLRLFLYQNKVNRDFLIQKEFGIETSISFDIFNRRETGVQFKYKP